MEHTLHRLRSFVSIFAVLAIIIALSSQSAYSLVPTATLFSDGFESGDFSSWTSADAVGWTTVNNPVNAYSGSYRAQVKGNTVGDTSIRETISTVGYTSINLTYWARVSEALEASDHFIVEWSVDGLASTTIQDLTSTATTSWAQTSYTFPSTAEDQPNLTIRFIGNMSGSTDEVRLDDVQLTGVVAATPTPSPTSSQTPVPTLGQISGYKFNDLNGNGVWDSESDESGLSEWTMCLTPEASPEILTVLEESPCSGQTTQTNNDGYYTFSELVPGQYTVSEVQQDGWTQTAPEGGTYPVTIEGSDEISGRTFGNQVNESPSPTPSGTPGPGARRHEEPIYSPTPTPSPTGEPEASPTPTETPEVLGASTQVGDPANLAKYNLKDGDLIAALDYGDPDIYIVGANGYKRLFLNPEIFRFYPELGGWRRVKHVTPEVRDAFPTSGLYRNCATGNPAVYGLEVTGEDTGVLHHINITAEQALSSDPHFFEKVSCVNGRELSWYSTSDVDYASYGSTPVYHR